VISKEEYIRVETFKHLVPSDRWFDGEHEPEAGLVFCDPEKIKFLFEDFTTKPYVIVSCASDASLVYQQQAPVNRDMLWYKAVLEQVAYMPPDSQYQMVKCPPRCLLDMCKYTDAYSIRYAHFTHSTFNKIPENILHWFGANMGISDDGRLSCLPFGISPNVDKLNYRQDKSKLLYVNFQDFSHLIRQPLREYYKEQSWVTYVDKALPFEEYAEQLSQHKFVLSPPGNGLDCYRTWESIYSGSIPIVVSNNWWQHFHDLPILATNNLFSLTPEILNRGWDMMNHHRYNFDKAKASYWKEKINAAVNVC
jgi:hypothetical protein